jgi:hypothetical protein
MCLGRRSRASVRRARRPAPAGIERDRLQQHGREAEDLALRTRPGLAEDRVQLRTDRSRGAPARARDGSDRLSGGQLPRQRDLRAGQREDAREHTARLVVPNLFGAHRERVASPVGGHQRAQVHQHRALATVGMQPNDIVAPFGSEGDGRDPVGELVQLGARERHQAYRAAREHAEGNARGLVGRGHHARVGYHHRRGRHSRQEIFEPAKLDAGHLVEDLESALDVPDEIGVRKAADAHRELGIGARYPSVPLLDQLEQSLGSYRRLVKVTNEIARPIGCIQSRAPNVRSHKD